MDTYTTKKLIIGSHYGGGVKPKKKKIIQPNSCSHYFWKPTSVMEKAVQKQSQFVQRKELGIHTNKALEKKECNKKLNNIFSFSSTESVNIIDFKTKSQRQYYLSSGLVDQDDFINEIITKVENFPSRLPDNMTRKFLENLKIEIRFNQLAKRWKRDLKFFSFAYLAYTHEDYLKIIKMGKKALPYILKDLEKTRRYWFHALTQITGESIIKEEDKGDLNKMTKCWLDWAKKS